MKWGAVMHLDISIDGAVPDPEVRGISRRFSECSEASASEGEIPVLSTPL